MRVERDDALGIDQAGFGQALGIVRLGWRGVAAVRWPLQRARGALLMRNLL